MSEKCPTCEKVENPICSNAWHLPGSIERREKEIMTPSVIAGCVWWVSGKCLHRGRYAEDCKENECPICQIIELERRERMDLKRLYYDTEGNQCNISQMVKREPEWAANIIQHYESALARERESVHELFEANIRLEAEVKELGAFATLRQNLIMELEEENKKAKNWCLYMLELMMPKAEPFDDLPGLTTQVDHAFAGVRDKLEAEVERLKQEIRYPHIDCFYNGGCGCNNLRLGVEPKEAAKKAMEE